MRKGIPTVKELYQGFIVNMNKPQNRHLKLAGLEGWKYCFELHEGQFDEDDEDFDIGEEEPFDEDDDSETCDDQDCETCKRYICLDTDSDIEEQEDVYYPYLVITKSKNGKKWSKVDIMKIDNEPLCRFLNQINSYNDL